MLVLYCLTVTTWTKTAGRTRKEAMLAIGAKLAAAVVQDCTLTVVTKLGNMFMASMRLADSTSTVASLLSRST